MDKIHSVQINLQFSGKHPGSKVSQRMSDSLQVVADQLLLGREQTTIAEQRLIYNNLLLDIGDRVFTGYQVQRVDVHPESVTMIDVHLRPWGDLLVCPQVNMAYSNVHPLFQPILEKHLAELVKEMQDIYTDAPSEATVWLNNLAQERCNIFAREHLPDFRLIGQFQTRPAPQAELLAVPIGREITGIKVDVRSRNIPQTLMIWTKEHVEKVAGSLQGLPVNFARKNQQLLEELLLAEINRDKTISKYKLLSSLQLKVAENSELIVQIDLADYNFWVRTYLDLGRRENTAAGVVHLGYDLGKHWEVFNETTWRFDNMKLEADLGVSRRIGSATFTYARRISPANNILRIEYPFKPLWLLRLERRTATNENELGIRYRFHDFISAEYIFSKNKSWLRLVANL